MRFTIAFCLIGSALAAPTKTIEPRQLNGLEPSSSGGLGALASLIPGLGSGSTGSSTGGFTLPSGLSIPGLSNVPGLGGSSGISSLSDNAKRQSSVSSTSNDVTDKKACQPLTFIFARGSDEIGNMGTVVGPAVANQLKSLTGDKVLVQGVNYAATAEV